MNYETALEAVKWLLSKAKTKADFETHSGRFVYGIAFDTYQRIKLLEELERDVQFSLELYNEKMEHKYREEERHD